MSGINQGELEADFWKAHNRIKVKKIEEILRPISAFIPGNPYKKRIIEESKILEDA